MNETAYPVKYTNVLPVPLFNQLSEEIITTSWVLTNRDYDELTPIRSWGKSDNQSLLFYQVGIRIKYRVQQFCKQSLRLCKIHTNGQTMGQLSKFHCDAPVNNVWTFVLFTNSHWDTNWGGEFTLCDPLRNDYVSVSYIPNAGVLFPANWDHRGAPPLIPNALMRTSIAFMYSTEDALQQLLEVRPALSRFL